MNTANNLRAIAIHLPQFHPIRENDAWWGKGFTEWTNVAKARSLFKGHYQPQLPAAMGFYDLRLPEVRQEQADMARAHGISGFCYYHYWFNGRRLLERPVNEILASKQPDFPFCLCWANENWTRRWDGKETEVLMGQTYGDEDDRNHVQSLLPALTDERYIRINGRPVFLFYRASNMPEPRRTVDNWRKAAKAVGIGELYLCNVESLEKDHGNSKSWGFDAAVEFAPDASNMPPRLRKGKHWGIFRRLGLHNRAFGDHLIFDYDEAVKRMLAKPSPPYLRYRCVMPSWDNSPRRRVDGLIFRGATPESYERWLAEVVSSFKPPSPEENLVFINAWNEWAEGNHLEPCQRWGFKYLESTKRALALAPNT